MQTVGQPVDLAGRPLGGLHASSTRIEEDNSTRTEIVPRAGRCVRARRAASLHYGKDITDRVVDRRQPAANTRPIGSSGPSIPRTRRTAPVQAGRRCRPAPSSALTRSGSRSRRTSRSRRKSAAYASDFEKRHEERFKGVTFDWKDFQRDGAAVPRAEPRARGRRTQLVVQPAGGGDAEGARRHATCGPSNIAWHPERTAARLHRRSRLARRAEVRAARICGRSTTDGKVTRLTERRVRLRRRRLLAGRQVPVLRALVRHRHDHPAEAESRRSARSLHPPGRRRRSRSTSRRTGISSRATPQWSPDSRFIYFTAEIGGENHLFRVAAAAGARSSRSRRARGASAA